MKITKEWLKDKGACGESYAEFEGSEMDGVKAVKKCIRIKRLDWANWLIVRIMEYKQYVSYAVFAAEQVIDIFERKYPEDNRPRKAIEAAKSCIANPSKENKSASSAYAAVGDADADAAIDSVYYINKTTKNKKWKEIEVLLRRHLNESLLDDDLFII